MVHALDGYNRAKESRGRFVITRTENGTETFFAGVGGFSSDREETVRFTERLVATAARFPGARIELA